MATDLWIHAQGGNRDLQRDETGGRSITAVNRLFKGYRYKHSTSTVLELRVTCFDIRFGDGKFRT